MFGRRVLDVRVDQNIDVWEQQVELGTEPSLVVHGVQRTQAGRGQRLDAGGLRARSPTGTAAVPLSPAFSARRPKFWQMNALTLMLRADASRRTCLAS